MPSEWWYDGDGAVLPYNQIVAPISSGRLFGVVGEKSIEYPRKVYRVFSYRTIHPLRILPSSAPLPSYKRSDTSHSKLRRKRSNKGARSRWREPSMRKNAKGERYHCPLPCKPTQKETQRKGGRNRWVEQCYARKRKKGRHHCPPPFNSIVR